jgi:cyd operon protein YbgT
LGALSAPHVYRLPLSSPIQKDRLRRRSMWYFAWILGVLLALAFGVINVMWYESEHCLVEGEDGAA